MFYVAPRRAKEAGASISQANMEHVQSIHDGAASLGADCAAGSAGMGGWVYESARICEAALPMNTSHDALRGHLRDALRTAHNAGNSYSDYGPYVTDVFPSHVVYSHQGQTLKRSYSVEPGAAGTAPKVTLGQASKVHTAYVDSKESDDGKEAMRILTDVPSSWIVDERFISKQERSTADAADFAGKGRSFPILVAEDVQAALSSIGRAGADNHDAATLKANILKIAKRKGFNVPKSDSESVMITLPDGSEMVSESTIFCSDYHVNEAGAVTKGIAKNISTVPVKLIGPGWGSMAHYSKETIQQGIKDGVWHKGLHMYMDHMTPTEEAERPENSVKNLAAVLKENAYWSEGIGGHGPGAYANAMIFPDHAETILSKGPYIGASINAAIRGKEGEAEGRKGRIAEKFIKVFSTDFVTKAGAKGAVVVPVTESARAIPQLTAKESIMTEQEVQAMQAELAALKTRNATLEAERNQTLAAGAVATILRESGVEGIKSSLIIRMCGSPVMKEGKVDQDWAKSVAADLIEVVGESGGRVVGMGQGNQTRTNTVDVAKEAATKNLRESLKAQGVPEAGLEIAVRGY